LAGGGDDGGRADLALGIDVLRGLADQELARAEAARSRSRQAFALAAGFFAVVQTVTFGGFVTNALSKAHQTPTLIHHATAAGIALAACGLALLIAELPFPSRDLTPEQVLDTLNAPPSDRSVTGEFAHLYAMVVAKRRQTNRRRSRVVAATQLLALITIGLVVWELLASLHAIL
jgi:hypothetical protein